MGSIAVKFGNIHTLKMNNRGMAEMRSHPRVQAYLIDEALDIADAINSVFDGRYEVGPDNFSGGRDWEPVMGVRHNPPEGAHAFIRTADELAEEEQRMWNVLNSIS